MGRQPLKKRVQDRVMLQHNVRDEARLYSNVVHAAHHIIQLFRDNSGGQVCKYKQHETVCKVNVSCTLTIMM